MTSASGPSTEANSSFCRRRRCPAMNAGESTSLSKSVAQYEVDARLHAAFERSEDSRKSFNYYRLLQPIPPANTRPSSSTAPEQQITAYLSKIQRGGYVQPFGCMIAVDQLTFKVIAFSDNARELIGETQGTVAIGSDIRMLFTQSGSQLIERAFAAREIALMNPVCVYTKNSGRPFYGVLHRIDVGIVLDLEPARNEDPAWSVAGVVQSQKLAVRAISKLQSLPGGDVKSLCGTVVNCMRELTGYDRVMVYKFHEDEHGEVVAESRRADLESYLGLHYPATDIPQASRFLFKQSRVRMIVDCNADPVRVIQDERLKQPLCLVGSTLRAPHGCHTLYMKNMGSIASLAMAVITNEGSSSGRLWGLVVCHHTTAKRISYPLRYACEFFVQAFGLQLNMEIQVAAQMSEKHVLRTQTLLCDLLLRNSPSGIIKQSPSIKDLVKCDGAALYYQGEYHSVGISPSESQIHDIIEWLLLHHGDSTGLSTDSLNDAEYPGASLLGDEVCGMAVAYISRRDFIFWFRSHTAKEIKWGGAKHHPDDKDDGQRMHPRSSFSAFLEVVKSRSAPWETADIDAIYSLQLILRDAYKNTVVSRGKDELTSVAKEIVRLIETASAPIFAVDGEGRVNGWNEKIARLTGIPARDAMGRSFVGDITSDECRETAEKLILDALRGEERKNVELKLKKRSNEAVYVVVNACSSKDYFNNIVGACFVGQDVTVQKTVTDKFMTIQGDYKAIIHSPSPLIPPIFASDENTACSEWNAALEKLTGWRREETLGKTLVGEVFGNLCRLNGPDSLTKFMIVLHSANEGDETEWFPFSFYDREGKLVQTFLTANKKINTDGKVVGSFCFLQFASPELQQALKRQRQPEANSINAKEMSYICREIKKSLNGIRFANSRLEATPLTDDQKQYLQKSSACEKEILKIIEDTDLETIENGSLKLKSSEFLSGNITQAATKEMVLSTRKINLRLMGDIP